MAEERRAARGCLRGFLIFTGIAVAVIAAACTVTGLVYINTLPTLEELDPSPIAQTSKVYDINGDLLTEFHAEENREIIDFDDMSQNIKDAVVSIEDKRYYDHQGVDYIRIVGAAIADIKASNKAQGASTITQQVVKNIYFSPEKTWRRKINEALVAIQMERNYSKDRILEIYLNTVYFGTGTYGIEKASEIYLGKHASDLNIPEAALLAGMIQAPEVYSPFNNIESAKLRRDTVLKAMYDQEMISSQDYIDSLAEPIVVNEAGNTIGDTASADHIAPYFIDYVKTQLYDQQFSDFDVFEGGLRIYTTLDPDLQQKAEQAVNTVFPEEIDPSYSLICSDPDNGYIYALIGGKDYNESKFNIATQGRRQPGSVFKTLVLMEAVRQDFSAKNEFPANGPITIDMPEGPDWEVDNYAGEKFEDDLSVADATVHSVNVVFAQLVMQIGAENVEALCSQMDIDDIGSNPAIALGGLETGITPLNVSKVFSTLASGGTYHAPVTILEITDSGGKTLFQYDPEEEGASKRILSVPVADYITRILQRVINEGTGRGAGIGRPAAGKTGTTSDYKDAWFAGYTPDLVTVVWMGNAESSVPMDPINGRIVVGGTYPADIWREFMSAALEDTEVSNFNSPEGSLIDVQVCSESGKLPVFWCPEDILEWKIFVKGEESDDVCDIHNKVEVPDLTGMVLGEARAMLEELFIEPTELEEFNDTYNSGIIFDQEPEPGSLLESLTGEKLSMIIYVSKGEETFNMPDLTGYKLEKASSKMARYDSDIDNVIYEYSDLQPIDYIFSQSPSPDSLITKSIEVTVYISKGENPEAEVPDVIGLTEAEALDLLSLEGFDNVVVTYEESEEEMDLVFSQAPESGTVYDKLLEVHLIISQGVPVPDVTGMELEDAVTALEDDGFTAIILPEGITEGTVLEQSPLDGEYASYGSEVTLTIDDSTP